MCVRACALVGALVGGWGYVDLDGCTLSVLEHLKESYIFRRIPHVRSQSIAGAYMAPAVSTMLSAVFLCYVSWDSILYFYGEQFELILRRHRHQF